jgi:adenylate kinase family enzyme
VPQIVILGPPASGKRTISKMVSNKLRTAHLTPDNLVSEAETDIKSEAQAFIKKNQVFATLLSEKNVHLFLYNLFNNFIFKIHVLSIQGINKLL